MTRCRELVLSTSRDTLRIKLISQDNTQPIAVINSIPYLISQGGCPSCSAMDNDFCKFGIYEFKTGYNRLICEEGKILRFIGLSTTDNIMFRKIMRSEISLYVARFICRYGKCHAEI